MNDLTIESVFATKTMTSREIAELCKKRHKDILSDIRDILAGPESRPSSEYLFTESSYLGKDNAKTSMYVFNFKAAMLLVTKYSTEARMAVIDKWVAAEAKLIALENEKVKTLQHDLNVCLLQNKAFTKRPDMQLVWSEAEKVGMLARESVIAEGKWRVMDSGRFMFNNSNVGVRRKKEYLEMSADELLAIIMRQ